MKTFTQQLRDPYCLLSTSYPVRLHVQFHGLVIVGRLSCLWLEMLRGPSFQFPPPTFLFPTVSHWRIVYLALLVYIISHGAAHQKTLRRKQCERQL